MEVSACRAERVFNYDIAPLQQVPAAHFGSTKKALLFDEERLGMLLPGS
jgi:hypothetical protein